MSKLTIIGAVPIFILGLLWMILKEKRKLLSNCLSFALAAYVCFAIIRLAQNPAFVHKVEVISSAENSESSFSNPYLVGINPNPEYKSSFRAYPWLLELYVFGARRSEKALSEASSYSSKFAAYDAIVLFLSDEKFDKPLKILSQSKDVDGPALAKDLQFALGKIPDNTLSDIPRLVEEFETDLKSRLKPSWYRSVALHSMYVRWGEHKRLEQIKLDESAQNIALNGPRIAFAIFYYGAAAIGFLICLAQPFVWWLTKRGKIKEWLAPAKILTTYRLRTVVDVVLAYAALRAFIGGLFRDELYRNLIPDVSEAFEIMWLLTVFALIVDGGALLSAYLLAFRTSKISFADGIGLRFASGNIGPFKMILVGCLTFCLLFPFASVATLVSTACGAGTTANPINILIAVVIRFGDSATVILSIFLIALLGPCLEEAFFRGFLFSALRAKYGATVGVLVSSLVFAAMHLDLPGFLPLFSIGVVFALAYWKTNSIIPSLIAHCAWNGALLIMAMLIG